MRSSLAPQQKESLKRSREEISRSQDLFSEAAIREVLIDWWDTRIFPRSLHTDAQKNDLDQFCLAQITKQMTNQEYLVWNHVFCIEDRLRSMFDSGLLKAQRPHTLLYDSFTTGSTDADEFARFMFGSSNVYDPIDVDPSGFNFLLQTTVNAQTFDANHNIACDFDHEIFVLDGKNNLVITEQTSLYTKEGPHRPNGRIIYVPFGAANTFVTFTTRINPSIETKMTINEHTSNECRLILGIMLHDRKKIPRMNIIKDPRVQVAFWQTQQFTAGHGTNWQSQIAQLR